jgi:two-component system CheB/CheR fusion protein
MKSANEEIQSTNEELQSTNEELETAKEELQSTNEELATVNEELENRNAELSGSNNDFTNLLASVNLPILMLGHDLTIRQFTPQAEKLLNLIASDLGRPIGNIKPNIDIPDLEALVLEVIDTMTTKALEVRDKAGHWYSVRLRPYRTMDNRIDGAVITFIDIDTTKDMIRLQSALERERRLATVVRDANDAVTVIDFAGNILAWNPAAQRIYGYAEKDALRMNVERLIPKEDVGRFRQILATLRKGALVEAFETQRIRKDGSKLSVRVNVTALLDESGVPYGVATTECDLANIQLVDE